MKHFYFVVLFALFPVLLFAQEDGVEQEIKNYKESRIQLISKGRRLLMDKFLEGDIAKVKEVKDYLLTEVQTEDYIGLFPWEQWLIMYWTGEHEGMAEKILQVDDQTVATYNRKILPERDLLFTKLIEKS